ncbi:MAG: hypothetical protein ACI9YL_001517 [Luteibaculaceae bacterium]|jgi:hypothetical protein
MNYYNTEKGHYTTKEIPAERVELSLKIKALFKPQI